MPPRPPVAGGVARYLPPRSRSGGRLDIPANLYPHVARLLEEAKPLIRESIDRRKGLAKFKVPYDIVEWAESRFYIPSTGKPIVLFPHQKALLRLAFTRTTDGWLPYRTLLYSTIKQSGKSTIAAVIERWYAENHRYSELYCLGNDQEQARLRSYREIRWSIEQTPGYDRGRNRLPGEWTVLEKTMRCVRTSSEIRALAIDSTGEAGGKPAIQTWCVDDQTDCLTRAGWKRVVDLTTGDEVATLEPESGRLVWERPRHVNVTHYAGPMLHFNHRRVDFVVTPNHRVYGRFQTHSRYRKQAEQRGWWFEEARVAAKMNSGWLKGDASWRGDSDFDEALARFLGYYISEGHTTKNRITISQSLSANPEVYARIQQAIMDLGYSPYTSTVGMSFGSPALAGYLRQFGKSSDKYIPQDLKDSGTAVLRAFFDAYIEGDGWRAGSGLQCCTVSKRLADDLLEVALKLGYHPRLMSVKDSENPNHQTMYRLSFSTGTIYWQRNYGKSSHWSEEQYDGLVACPSVGSGIFYIRRNGKCVWTGNTELWGFESQEALRFWNELTPIPTIPDSMRIVETYAGFEGESKLLKGLYDTGMKSHQLSAGELDSRTGCGLGVFEESQHPDDPVPIWEDTETSQLTYWDEGEQARRMPWQRGDRGDQYYRQQRNALLVPDYERFHHNLWVASTGAFIRRDMWDKCLDADVATPLQPGDRTPVVLAADAATSSDCFAIVIVSRYPDPVRRNDEVVVRGVMVFDPKETGGVVDYDTAERYIRFVCQGGHTLIDGHTNDGSPRLVLHPRSLVTEGCKRCQDKDHDVPGLNVVQVCYDTYQLASMMQRITKDSVAWCEPFEQGKERLIGDRSLYDLILGQRVWHNGDPRLTEHVMNAGAKVQKDEDSKLRLVKRDEAKKIDAVVALSMAAKRCLDLVI